jgi:nucleoside-diphosphate-sugar epimerase
MKKILLTGAFGEVGIETLKELIRRKIYDIRVFDLKYDSLNKKNRKKIAKSYINQIKVFWGDLRNYDEVLTAVNKADIVLHIGALIPPAADKFPEEAWKINKGGTKNIIKAMEAQDKKPRLIYTSSISVYGDRIKDPRINVNDPFNPSMGDEYSITKIEAEKLVQSSNLEWTIFRLTAIMNPRMKIQPIMFHLPLDTSLEICRTADTGYALVQAIECDELFGNIYNLSGGEKCRITARDYLKTNFKIFGLDPNIIPENAYATRNFHCGYYADGDKLEELLHFQRDGLKEHFDAVKECVPASLKIATKILPKRVIRKYLLRMSEPLKAIKRNEEEHIRRFYGSREEFEKLPKK